MSRTYHDMAPDAAEHARQRDAERAYVATWKAETAAGVALPAAGPLFDLPEPARPAAPARQLDAFNLDLFGV